MWEHLPEGVLSRVFAAADYKTLRTAKCVCNGWSSFITDNANLWRDKCEADFQPKDMEVDPNGVGFERLYGIEWMLRHGDPKVTILDGHDRAVTSVKCFGDTVASCSSDGTVRVWNLRTNECIHVLETGKEQWCVAVDEERVACGTCEGEIYVWRLASGELLRTWKGHGDAIVALDFDGDRLITGGMDELVACWDLGTYECVWRVGKCEVVCTHVDEKEIMCGCWSDFQLYVMDKQGEALGDFRVGPYAKHICTSALHIFVGNGQGTVKVFDRNCKDCLAVFERGYWSRVMGVGCLFGTLLCIAYNKCVEVWDLVDRNLDTCQKIRCIEIDGIQNFHCENGRLVIGLGNGSVQVYDFEG